MKESLKEFIERTLIAQEYNSKKAAVKFEQQLLLDDVPYLFEPSWVISNHSPSITKIIKE